MIWIGLDDTDTLESPGTNQLARALARRIQPHYSTRRIVRHQLFFDPRVPYTRKNGSASLCVQECTGWGLARLIEVLREEMVSRFVPGSDPGLCVATGIPDEIIAYGKRCQTDLMTQREARDLARSHGIHLEGLGGTEGGVIGALAAIGLAATEDDGRIIQWEDWPDDLSGPQDWSVLQARGVTVVCQDTLRPVTEGTVDVGKHLRPNLRQGRAILFVVPMPADVPSPATWQALKLT